MPMTEETMHASVGFAQPTPHSGAARFIPKKIVRKFSGLTGSSHHLHHPLSRHLRSTLRETSYYPRPRRWRNALRVVRGRSLDESGVRDQIRCRHLVRRQVGVMVGLLFLSGWYGNGGDDGAEKERYRAQRWYEQYRGLVMLEIQGVDG